MKSICYSIGLILIGPILIFLCHLQTVQANQTESNLSMPLPSATLSLKELKSRRTSIENMSNIDERTRADSLNYIDQAIGFLGLSQASQEKSKELSKIVSAAPERLKTLKDSMKKMLMANEKVEPVNSKLSTNKLEQLFRQKEAEYTNAQTNLKKWNDQLTTEQSVIKQTSEQLVSATNRLKEIQILIEQLSGTPENDLLNATRLITLKTEQKMLQTKINLYEQQQRSHNLILELLRAERDVAERTVNLNETAFKESSKLIQSRRQEEAVQSITEAQDAILNVPLQPPIIQDQFDVNIRLSTELEKITNEETKLAEKLREYQSRLKLLESELETAKKRVDLDILTDVIGMALRNQRRNLPVADQYLMDSKSYRIRMSEISERQIELDQSTREISSPESLTNELIQSSNKISKTEQESLVFKLQDTITTRHDIIQKMKSGYDRIIRLMQDIEFSKKRLIMTSESFGELLDRHLLWIRSSKPITITEIINLKFLLLKYFKYDYWQNRLMATKKSMQDKPGLWILFFIAGFFLLPSGKWAKRQLKNISESIDQQSEDSFFLTIKALGLTILLSAIWPYLLIFPVLPFPKIYQTAGFSGNLNSDPIYYCWIIIFWILVYNICRPYGLAQTHFRWPESVNKTLKRHLKWFIPIEVLSAYLILIMETNIQYDYQQSLGKLAIVIQCIAVSAFAAILLRFNKGITSILIDKYPNTWITRFRYIWFFLSVFIPIYVLWLAMTGYYYSAVEIRYFFYKTISLVVTLIIVKHLALRLLMLARRNIAFKKAVPNTPEIAQKNSSSPGIDSRGDKSSIEETIAKLNNIDGQTRTLLNFVVFIFGLVGIWVIWEPVFPAFGILQDVRLWDYSTIANGAEKVVPITLANIVLAVIVITTMFIAVQNLPGLIEIILLNRLPMDAGARYAYTTVCRYAIIALGVFIALNAVGIRWSNLQWLVAALSVGLGFGLQEIVANFISGLIVLFERPFSVGDTVTVGDVNGTVTRIRIRATTIEDWDRKELIVPNKDFITGKLINWSLTDRIIRIKVPVGIAYGSDTDLAEKIMLDAAKNNALVIKSPKPSVVFLKFGDNSLDYEVRVFIKCIEDWIPMLHTINRTINNNFNENDITIAFPQRDVHLDITKPLSVKVVPKRFAPSLSKADS